jgi:uncharacterized OB-fold protein
MRTGTVYTETLLHSAAPYQVAIVTLDEGDRVTARIEGDRVAIDDRVAEIESRDGVPFFRKS